MSVWAKVHCVCCVVSFPKFHYNDLLQTSQQLPRVREGYGESVCDGFGALSYALLIIIMHRIMLKIHYTPYKGKGKVDHAPLGRRWGAHLPLIAVEPVGG